MPEGKESFKDTAPKITGDYDKNYESYEKRKEKEIDVAAKRLMQRIADSFPEMPEEGTEVSDRTKAKLARLAEKETVEKEGGIKKGAPKNKAEKIELLVERMQVGDQIEVAETGDTILYTIKEGGLVSFITNGIQETIPIDRMKKHLALRGVAFRNLTTEGISPVPEKATEARINVTEDEKKKMLLEQFNAFLMNEVREIESSGLRDKTKLYYEFAEKYGLELTSIKEIKTPEDIETERKAKIEREETIRKIGELFRNGVDKIVIHGNTIENSEIKDGLVSNPDANTLAALYLLNDVAQIKYNEGAETQIVPKGQEVPAEEGKIIVHVDVGGKTLSVVSKDNSTVAFVDHHQEGFNENQTSSTQLIYEIISKNDLVEKKWINREVLENLTSFITSVDNLSYADDKNFADTFKYKWAGSLFAIYKQLPMELIVQFFKEGRDPWNPEFTKDEKKRVAWDGKYLKDPEGKQLYEKDKGGNDTTKPLKEKISLGQVIAKNSRAFNYALTQGFSLAVEQMQKNGIRRQTKKMGKVFFNTTDPQIGKDGQEKVNWLGGEMGFLFAKANGYDTYVSYNKNEGQIGRTNGYFINSTTYDLEPVLKDLQAIVPETVLVRGVMILGPQASEKRNAMTEEKFFDALELKR